MKTRAILAVAVIGAAYAALTLAFAPIAYGPIQFRISEALCVLPFFLPISSVGLAVGCVIANIFSPAPSMLDIVFGPLATLLAGFATASIKRKWLAPLPPVIFNGVIVGAVLAYTYFTDVFWSALPIVALQVAFGEVVVLYALGLPLIIAIQKNDTLKSLLTVHK